MNQSFNKFFREDKSSIGIVAQSIHQLQKASYLQANLNINIEVLFVRRNEGDLLIKNSAPDCYIFNNLDSLKNYIHRFQKIIFFSMYASNNTAQLIEVIDELAIDLLLVQETHTIPTHQGLHIGINFTPDKLFAASDEDKYGLEDLKVAPGQSIASYGWMFQLTFYNWLHSKDSSKQPKSHDGYLVLLGAPSVIAVNAYEDLKIRVRLLNALKSSFGIFQGILKPHPMERASELKDLLKVSQHDLSIWSDEDHKNPANFKNIITSAYSQAAIDCFCMQKDFIMYAFSEDNFLTNALSENLVYRHNNIRIYEVKISDPASQNIVLHYLKDEKASLKLFHEFIGQPNKISNAAIRKLEILLAQFYFNKNPGLKSFLEHHNGDLELINYHKIIFQLKSLDALPEVQASYANNLYLYPIIIRAFSQIVNPPKQLIQDFVFFYADAKFFQVFLIETLILNNILRYKNMMPILGTDQLKNLHQVVIFFSSNSKIIRYAFSALDTVYEIFPRFITFPIFKLINFILKSYAMFKRK